MLTLGFVEPFVEKRKYSVEANVRYCSKDGDIWLQYGEEPLTSKEKGKKEKKRWRDAVDSAKNGDIDSIDPDIFLRHYSALKKIREDYRPKPDNNDSLDNIWIFGKTGLGKSRIVHSKYGKDVYIKELNKWWDGYDREEVVLVDDIDPDTAKFMVKFIKNWTDHYRFPAQSKGGYNTSGIRPKRIIFTSNYSIDDCFFFSSKDDIEALKRRFRIIEMTESNKSFISLD